MKNKLLLTVFACLALNVLHSQSVFDSLYAIKTTEIYFESGKSDLSEASVLALDSFVAIFHTLDGAKSIRITAHTDSVGSLTFNEALAKRRAGAVSAWFQKRGIPATSIQSVETFGERLPAASNQTETGRRRNRRATVEMGRIVPMAAFSGRVTNQKSGEGIAATVFFSTKTRSDSIRTDTSGKYSVRLPKDSVVKIEAVAVNYFFDYMVRKIHGSPELYQKSNQSTDIALPPAITGEKITVRNLFFVGNEAILLKASEPELPKILRFMQINPGVFIEIAGHINKTYPEKHNFKLKPGQTPAEYLMEKAAPWEKTLSLRRAETVYNYLVRNGISKDRMTFKGYSNSEMLFPHAANDQQAERNRRVEIRITKNTQ